MKEMEVEKEDEEVKKEDDREKDRRSRKIRTRKKKKRREMRSVMKAVGPLIHSSSQAVFLPAIPRSHFSWSTGGARSSSPAADLGELFKWRGTSSDKEPQMLLKGPLKVAAGAGFLQSGSSLAKIIEMWMCLIFSIKLKL